jgi:hypothetical protein
MIRPTRTHSQFEFFQTRRAQLNVKVPHDETSLWCKFRRLDLSAAYPILVRLYNPDQGRPARPPEDMLRSCLLTEGGMPHHVGPGVGSSFERAIVHARIAGLRAGSFA